MIKQITLLFFFLSTISYSLKAQEVVLRGQRSGINIAKEKQVDKMLLAEEISIDTFFLLLGTLSDYMGRSIKESQIDQVDHYYPGEKALYEFLLNNLGKVSETPLRLDQSNESRVVLHSEDLAQKIRLYYDINRYGRSSKDGKQWEKNSVSRLKEQIFENDLQKRSFLLGVVLRYGQKIDSGVYKLSLSNSVSTEKKAVHLLHEMGCQHIYFERKADRIPVTAVIYFKATTSLQTMLEAYDPLLSDIERSKVDFYKEKIGIDISSYTSDKEKSLLQLWSE